MKISGLGVVHVSTFTMCFQFIEVNCYISVPYMSCLVLFSGTELHPHMPLTVLKKRNGEGQYAKQVDYVQFLYTGYGSSQNFVWGHNKKVQ